MLLLFSGGEIQRRPAFESYAFGSQKIRSYGASRIDMSFAYGTVNQGPLVRNPDQSGDKPVDYPEATYREEDSARQYFAIRNYYGDRDDTALYLDFCGTQNPSTSATFGQYSPMANGTPWRYPFEYPGKGDSEKKNGVRQIYAKRRRGETPCTSV